MAGIIQRACTRIYTFYCQAMGAEIGRGSVIHNSAEILNYKGIYIGKQAMVYKNVTIYTGISGKFILHDYSHVAPYGFFIVDNNKVEIGQDVAIGPFCSFFCHSNAYSEKEKLFRKNYIDGDISIGNNVFIGSHCVFLPGARVGDNIMIAANSVVKGVLENNYMYAGSPAEKVKSLDF